MRWGFGVFKIARVTLNGQTHLRIGSVRQSFFCLNVSRGSKTAEKLCPLSPAQVGTTEQRDIVPNFRSHEKSPHLGPGNLGSLLLPHGPGNLVRGIGFPLKRLGLCQEGRQRAQHSGFTTQGRYGVQISTVTRGSQLASFSKMVGLSHRLEMWLK